MLGLVTRHRALVSVIDWPTAFYRAADAGIHARWITTAAPRGSQHAGAMKGANVRIAKKAGGSALFDNANPEALERKKERLAQFLESRLQMNRTTAIRAIALRPNLVLSSHELLERNLDWLTRQGIDAKALHTIVRRCPQILQQPEESLEETKQWFLDQGIALSKIPFIFMTVPQVTALTLANLNHKVAFLRGMGLDKDQICRTLKQSPRVMAITVENMASKVEGVKSLGFTDADVVKLITLAPQFLALNMESIHRKLQALDEMFGEGEGVRLWLSSAHLIMWNTVELRRTFEYLTKVVGMPANRISQNILLIMRNVDRFVRPRYEYLTKTQSRDLKGVTWIRLTEVKFVSRHPDYADFLARDFKH